MKGKVRLSFSPIFHNQGVQEGKFLLRIQFYKHQFDARKCKF